MSDLSDLSDRSDAWCAAEIGLVGSYSGEWGRAGLYNGEPKPTQSAYHSSSIRVRQPIQINRKSKKSHHRSLRHQQERWGSGGRNLLLKATNVIPRCGTLRRRIKKSFRRKAGRFFNHSPQYSAAATRIPRAKHRSRSHRASGGAGGRALSPPCKSHRGSSPPKTSG